MKKRTTPFITAHTAREWLKTKIADIETQFSDSYGNRHLYLIRRDDRRLYRTLLNGVWIRAFENERLLPIDDMKERGK